MSGKRGRAVHLARSLLIVGLAGACTAVAHTQEDGGAAASDPTASVRYQDFRYRYFDQSQGSERHSFETENAFMLSPRLKVTNELRYVSDDRSGKSEHDFYS